MKRLVSWLMSGVLMAGLLLSLIIAPAAQADSLRNIAATRSASVAMVDLNNCSVRRFQAFPGMYDLAGKIVLGGPYNSVDDLFDLDLTDRQKSSSSSRNFTVTPRPSPSTKALIASTTANTVDCSSASSAQLSLNSAAGDRRRAIPTAFSSSQPRPDGPPFPQLGRHRGGRGAAGLMALELPASLSVLLLSKDRAPRSASRWAKAASRR